MKTIKNHIIKLCIILLPIVSFSQSADKIIDKYIELSGGEREWNEINAMKITGKVKAMAQSMELPFVRLMDKNGRQITRLDFNGMDYISLAYDGKKAWGSSQSMDLMVKNDDETHNAKIQKYDFPFPGFEWKKRGYKAEYMGTKTIDSTSTFHIRMTKHAQVSNGEEVDNIADLYFNTENYMPILVETIENSGPNKGQTRRSYLKDYRDVEGYMYPFITEMQYDEGSIFQIIVTEKVEWNPKLNDEMFEMPSKD